MLIIRGRKKSKYGNIKTLVDGELIDSKLEATDYRQFKLMQAAGVISNLRRQVPFEITVTVSRNGEKPETTTLRYKADFAFVEDGKDVVYESKGAWTDLFKFKWKHVQRLYPEWEFRITPKRAKRRRR